MTPHEIDPVALMALYSVALALVSAAGGCCLGRWIGRGEGTTACGGSSGRKPKAERRVQ